MIGTTWKWREPLALIEADKWWSDGGGDQMAWGATIAVETESRGSVLLL